MGISAIGTKRKGGNGILSSFHRNKRKQKGLKVHFVDDAQVHNLFNEYFEELKFFGGIKARRFARDSEGRWIKPSAIR